MTSVFTVAVPHIGNQVLLGHKKTKIGKGYWNGFGGRVELGESVEEAAARELREECGLVAEELFYGGLLVAHFRDSGNHFELHIFQVTGITGKVVESREMRPQWFPVNEIPYEQMWASNKLWLPLLLAGKHFSGTVWFDNLEDRRLLRHAIHEEVHV